MLIIDTNDLKTIKEYESKKRELEDSKEEVGKYDVDDFVMVRTTNHLDPDLTIKAICNVPFVTNINNIASRTIRDILKNQSNVNFYDDEEYEKFKQLANAYSPLSTQYRSTLHFTLNGLVSSHSKGNFDDKNFIVIDKLSNHLGKDDIRSIRMEDTFVSNEFALSEESIIMINYEKYQELIIKNPWLQDMPNVVLFKGDEKLATEILLTKLGIMPEKIQTHSAEYSERTSMHKDFFDRVQEKYGIEQEKHSYSPEYQSDDQKSLKLWDIYDKNFYNKLFEYFGVEEIKKNQMIEDLLSYRNRDENRIELLKNYIMEVGLENYQRFVLEYNNQILKSIEKGQYPTNEEILESKEIILNEQKNRTR